MEEIIHRLRRFRRLKTCLLETLRFGDSAVIDLNAETRRRREEDVKIFADPITSMERRANGNFEFLSTAFGTVSRQ